MRLYKWSLYKWWRGNWNGYWKVQLVFFTVEFGKKVLWWIIRASTLSAFNRKLWYKYIWKKCYRHVANACHRRRRRRRLHHCRHRQAHGQNVENWHASRTRCARFNLRGSIYIFAGRLMTHERKIRERGENSYEKNDLAKNDSTSFSVGRDTSQREITFLLIVC